MNLTGYLLMRHAIGEYKGVQGRVYAWPDHESGELARAFVQSTYDEPFGFVFRDRDLADQALALAAEFERDLSVVEVGVSKGADTLDGVRLPLGIDVAYPGGDFYSAIHQGLLGEGAAPDLQARFGDRLNLNKLFDSGARAADYLQAFRDVAASERDSDFVFYALGSTDRVQ